MKKTIFTVGMICVLLLFAGCTSNQSNEVTTTKATTATTQPQKETLTIAGSTTVQPIATKAAEVYMKANPNVLVSVQAGGSGAGIKMVSEGSVDIGTSSRDLKKEEMDKTPDLKPYAIAADGVVAVVHPSNTLSDLTKAQIKDIFSGNITNFKQLGGPDLEIVVVNREEGSGTRATFEELVMGSVKVTDKALQKPSNGAMKAAVAENENAIGFLGLGYVDETVKALKVSGVAPSVATIKDGTYPVSRKLYLITKGDATGQEKKFIDFLLSAEGQKIVEEEKFIKI